MSCRSPLTVPMITVPMGSTPEADRIGSIWAMPAFIARAQASTSGTKMKFSAELDADDAHAGDQAVVHDLERLGALRPARLDGQRVHRVIVALDQGRGDVLHLGPHRREQRDVALDLVRPFEKLLDLVADHRVGDVGKRGHGDALRCGTTGCQRASVRCGHARRASRAPPAESRAGSRPRSGAGWRTPAPPPARRRRDWHRPPGARRRAPWRTGSRGC